MRLVVHVESPDMDGRHGVSPDAVVRVSARVGEHALEGIDGAVISLHALRAMLEEIRHGLARDGDAHTIEVFEGSGRALRFKRDASVVHTHFVTSRWQRENADTPRGPSFDLASLDDAIEALPVPERVTPERDVPAVIAASPAHLGVVGEDRPPTETPAATTTRPRRAVFALVALLVGLCALGSGLAALAVWAVDALGSGYAHEGLREEVRDGVRVLVHPHLGFAIRHPEAGMTRAPHLDHIVRAPSAGAMRVEGIAYASPDETSVLYVRIERLRARESLTTLAARRRAELVAAGRTIVATRDRVANGDRTFEILDEIDATYALTVGRVLRDTGGRTYFVLVCTEAVFPEAFVPVIDSFARSGALLGRPRTLDAERARFPTRLVGDARFADDAPRRPPPIASGLEMTRFRSPAGELLAYVSRAPADGARHPAILWLHPGYDGVGDDCAHDTLAPYVRAGFVTMCPSWRGESGNPGRFELFHGELDDARAALSHLRGLPYVDPDRVYVLGHSTGGTLALLLATSTDGLRAVISIGGAPDVFAWSEPADDTPGFPPYDHARHDESYVRSPLYFFGDLRAPTFYVEGADDAIPGDILGAMDTAASTTPHLFLGVLVPGRNHFDVVEPTLSAFLPALVEDVRSGGGVSITADALTRTASAPSPTE